MPSCRKPANATGKAVPERFRVELVIQYQDAEEGGEGAAGYQLQRTQHRIEAGTTIRQLLNSLQLSVAVATASAADRADAPRKGCPEALGEPGPDASGEASTGADGEGAGRMRREVRAADARAQHDEKAPEGAALPLASAALIEAIEQKTRGLSRFGRRAWLDDPLQPDDRIEILCPILADARAARFERVAKTRAGRPYKRSGIRVAS